MQFISSISRNNGDGIIMVEEDLAKKSLAIGGAVISIGGIVDKVFPPQGQVHKIPMHINS